MKGKKINLRQVAQLASILIMVCAFATVYGQKIVHYDLYVTDMLIKTEGKIRRAIAVNGQIPMPTLFFTEGDTAEIVVHNLLKESTSLHWHGLYVPNKEDGVPYLTQMPIKPNSTYVYRFPIIQNGTHWYHSHSGLQEQLGMYGSLILAKKVSDQSFRKGIDDLPQYPVVLSDWTNYNPKNVHRMLHSANDWFGIKKKATQSYSEAIMSGHIKTKVNNEWKRMLAMDVSDVYYDQVWQNGRQNFWDSSYAPGSKIRLRVSNGGASSYFWLNYAGGKMTVVANDGNDVVPVEVDRLIIGVSETYDIVISTPTDGSSYEFAATTEDRTQRTSLFFGKGPQKLAPALPRLDYFAGMKMMNDMMLMNGDMHDMGMRMSWQKMDMNSVMYPELKGNAKAKESKHQHHMKHEEMPMGVKPGVTLNYAMLKSPEPTTLPANAPVRELNFELSGNMNRYVWSMDNKVLAESDKIKINRGEVLRIVLYNGSMMRHPMHLHGHDFRIINGQGEYAPLKNVLDIMPMETDTIEFLANMEGDWFFHCHILYHMMAGMNRVFTYAEPYANPELPDPKSAYRKLQRESNQPHFMAENDLATNGNDGMMMLQNSRWSLGTEWRLGYSDMHGYETETHLGRYIGKMQWLMPFVGFDWRYRKMGKDYQEKNIFGQTNSKDLRSMVSLGVNYTLPMLVIFQTEVFSEGTFRLQLEREDIPLAPRIRAGVMVNTDKEFMVGLQYRAAKNLAIKTHYDSDMGLGVGITVVY